MSNPAPHPVSRPFALLPLLGWGSVSVASLALAAFTVTCSAQSDLPFGRLAAVELRASEAGADDLHTAAVVGLMLSPGRAVAATGVPAFDWYRVTHKQDALQVTAVAAPVAAPGEAEAEAIDTRYIRVPGARIAEGRLPTVALADDQLVPRQDHAYALALGARPFTLSIASGPAVELGLPAGEGTVYTVRIDEDSYSFRLRGAGDGESRIVAAADIDSDGKPDFIVQVGDRELLLLSSRAEPGLNPPAAVLALQGEGR
jgi:hypothetical protein